MKVSSFIKPDKAPASAARAPVYAKLGRTESEGGERPSQMYKVSYIWRDDN